MIIIMSCFQTINSKCRLSLHYKVNNYSSTINKKVQVVKDQEKVQSEKDSHSKNRGGKKPNQQSGTDTKKTFRKPNEQLFFPIGGHSVTLT